MVRSSESHSCIPGCTKERCSQESRRADEHQLRRGKKLPLPPHLAFRSNFTLSATSGVKSGLAQAQRPCAGAQHSPGTQQRGHFGRREQPRSSSGPRVPAQNWLPPRRPCRTETLAPEERPGPHAHQKARQAPLLQARRLWAAGYWGKAAPVHLVALQSTHNSVLRGPQRHGVVRRWGDYGGEASTFSSPDLTSRCEGHRTCRSVASLSDGQHST